MGTRRAAVLMAAVLVCTAAWAGAQTPRLEQLMRLKLAHASQLLAAVVTSDWDQMALAADELERISQDPDWAALPSPEYARQSEAFLQAVGDLQVAARARDLDLAPQAYLDLTMSCVGCHREVARARLAR